MTIKMFKLMFSPDDTPGSGIGNIDTGQISDSKILKDILASHDDDGDKDEEAEEKEETEDEEDESESEGTRKRDNEDVDEKEETEEDDEEDEDSEDEEESEESEEEEEDNKEDDEDDLEAKSLYQKLKKKNPEILKAFPELRDVIHREGQFTEIFATPKEAEKAQENAQLLDHLYSSIASGEEDRTIKVFEAIEKNSKDHLNNFAHAFLPSIAKVSPDLYGEVLRIPIKKALQSMYLDGKKAGNKNLMASAIYAHEFFFDTQDIKSDFEPRKVEKSKEREELDKERESFHNEKLTEFRGDVNNAITHSMRNQIVKALEGISNSSGKELSEYEKRNLIRDIASEIDGLLLEDKRHTASIDSLVKQAKSSGLSKEWKSRVISAYLARARNVLPTAKAKVLKEAGIKVRSISKEVRRIVPGSPNNKLSGDKINWDKVDYSRTKDMDILNDRPIYKKDK